MSRYSTEHKDKHKPTVKNDKEMPKERYISTEETQKSIDDLRLI